MEPLPAVGPLEANCEPLTIELRRCISGGTTGIVFGFQDAVIVQDRSYRDRGISFPRKDKGI